MSESDFTKGKGAETDFSRACEVCGTAGLHKDNAIGKCAGCYRSLPSVAKISKTTVAVGVLSKLARQLVDRHGLPLGSKLLDLEPQTTAALLAGEVRIVPARFVLEPAQVAAPARQLTAADLGLPADHPLAGVKLDPALLADMVRRYRDLQPLPRAYARVVAPWCRAMRIESCKETPGERTKRLNRAKSRADVMRYVPRQDAPLDPSEARNAYGCDPKASHLPRHELPMRVAVSLSADGHGPMKIAKIAARAKRPVSKSVVHRLLARSKHRFDGAVAVKLGELASELRRPGGSRQQSSTD